MTTLESSLNQLEHQGYTVIEHVFKDVEVNSMLSCIDNADTSRSTFRKSTGLFAISQFFKELPEVRDLIFTNNFIHIIRTLFGTDSFVIKSIYFDKPGQSNWFVAYHQDLTISVDKRVEIHNFKNWKVKQDQFVVQPPVAFLRRIYTIRIHLNDTDENNGALKVIPGSHLKGVLKPKDLVWLMECETSCKVNRGGIMVMKPLLLHSSSKTVNEHKRRVIHIEFSNQELPGELKWIERFDYNSANNIEA